jgi:lipoprotein-anchoring transpeptidase ErfK/SrfK
MRQLVIRAVAILASLMPTVLSPDVPALAQSFGQPPAPDIMDADPGVDNTANEATLPEEYRHRPVFYRTDQPAGTIIVNTNDRFLYLIMGGNYAMRYGIGVGRDGFQWGSIQRITHKQEWPDWTPPPEMVTRQPYLPRFLAGGPGNPLGARAMYLGNTVYRIHGTDAPETIGHAVSPGCFRLVNNEVIDPYARVPVGMKVVVQHQ